MLKRTIPWMLLAGLALSLGACAGGGAEVEKPLTPAEIDKKITRTSESKNNSIVYRIPDTVEDDKGAQWRLDFLNIFKSSGNRYNYIQLRVDPSNNFEIVEGQPLELKIGSENYTLKNDAMSRNRIALYSVTEQLDALKKADNVSLTFMIKPDFSRTGTEKRTITIKKSVLDGWRKVDSIKDPNIFYPAATY
ncbi:MAG: DUF3122 domain-containing protein [Gloeobacterales cyanobacterium]